MESKGVINGKHVTKQLKFFHQLNVSHIVGTFFMEKQISYLKPTENRTHNPSQERIKEKDTIMGILHRINNNLERRVPVSEIVESICKEEKK